MTSSEHLGLHTSSVQEILSIIKCIVQQCTMHVTENSYIYTLIKIMYACPCVELHLTVWVISMALACYTCLALNLSMVCTVVASDTHTSLKYYDDVIHQKCCQVNIYAYTPVRGV